MALKEELQVLQGIDKLAYYRKLSNAATEEGHLLPYQTTHKFDPTKKVDTTATKNGSVASSDSVETKFEQEFLDSTSAIADQFYDSLFNDEVLEVWLVSRKRKNETGQMFAWYFRAKVNEDENDNDADDLSKRDTSFTVIGTPQRGWLTLPDSAQEEIDYVFHGLKASTADDSTGGGTPASASSAPASASSASTSAGSASASGTTPTSGSTSAAGTTPAAG